MTELRPLRSVLYLPASNARAVEKARGLPCDAVILDLEDAVAPDAKTGAREAAVAAVREGGFGRRHVAIRVNALATEWSAADFEAVSAAPVDAIVVPKVDTAEQAQAAVAAARGKPVWAMIESPRAVLSVERIAAVPGLGALLAGHADLAKDLRATPGPDRAELLYAMQAMLCAARAFGLVALDGVHTDIQDLDGVTRTSAQGAAMGYDGRTIVHPSHIDAANRAYAPTAEAIEQARGLIAAHEAAVAEGRGVTTYKGRLVEVLHVDEARRLLAFAAAIGD